MATQVFNMDLNEVEMKDIRDIFITKKVNAAGTVTDVTIVVDFIWRKANGDTFQHKKMIVDLAQADDTTLKNFIQNKILPKINENLGFTP